jgi:hypothetical protein
MKQIYLHVGAHKTASSFLQHLLNRDRSVLEEFGTTLISRDQMIDKPFYHLMKSYGAKSTCSLSGEFLNEFPENINYLFTNEDLFSAIKLSGFFTNLERGMSFFCDIFGAENVHVIVYTRNQCDYIESCYAQLIHIGSNDRFENFYNDNEGANLVWDSVIDRFMSLIPSKNISVQHYESIKTNGEAEFYKKFLSTFSNEETISKIRDIPAVSGRKANRSFSQPAIEIFEHAKGVLDEKDWSKLRAFLQNNFSTDTHGERTFLSETQKTYLSDIYRESNMRLFQLSRCDDANVQGYYI